MERDLVDIVKEKQYIELTADERAELAAYCESEDQYNQLKHVFVSVDSMAFKSPKPAPETKERLDSLFAQNYPKASPVWYNSALALVVPKGKPFYRQPLVQLAAVGLIALITVPFLMNNQMSTESSENQMAALETELVEEETAQEPTNDSDSGIAEEEISVNDEILEVNVAATETIETMGTLEVDLGLTSTGDMGPIAMEVMDAEAEPIVSEHPDGVFIGEASFSLSQPTSDQPEILDLLTTTF